MLRSLYLRVGSSDEESCQTCSSFIPNTGTSGKLPSASGHLGEVTPATYSDAGRARSSAHILRGAKIVAASLAVAALLLGLRALLGDPELLLLWIDYAKAHQWQTMPAYWLLNVVCVVLLLPGAPFQILAGGIWGLWRGSIASGTAALVANTAAFCIGRHAFREQVSEFVAARVPTFPAIDRAVAAEGVRLVLMLRLSPVLPDSLMNYALSLMSIDVPVFVAATSLATVPYTLMYSYVGSISTDIIKSMNGQGESTSTSVLGSTGMAVYLILFISMVLYVATIIRQAIADAQRDRAADLASADVVCVGHDQASVRGVGSCSTKGGELEPRGGWIARGNFKAQSVQLASLEP